jgi:hypothetical protein
MNESSGAHFMFQCGDFEEEMPTKREIDAALKRFFGSLENIEPKTRIKMRDALMDAKRARGQ